MGTKSFISWGVLAVLFFSSFPGLGRSQPMWNRKGRVQPPGRWGGAIAYDAERKVTLLFGGYEYTSSGIKLLSDTWVWDGKTWKELHPLHSPSPRIYHAMAYCPSRKKVVLFGGMDSLGSNAVCFGDTWEWDGKDWTKVSSAPSPSPRGYHAMAYFPNIKKVVLYGGKTGNKPMSDTWEWDGSKWKKIPISGPWAGPGVALAWDSFTRQMLLYYSNGPGSGATSGTFAFDGKTWTHVKLKAVPLLRMGFSMVSDPVRKRVLLVGGNVKDYRKSEEWVWDGTSWKALTVPVCPIGRHYGSMAFDSSRKRIVLFGGDGVSNTWEWDGVQWKLFGAPGWWDKPCMVIDGARNRLVLAGDRGGAFLDLWEYDGKVWAHPQPSSKPPVRRGMGAAWAPVRKKVVLFGGMDPSGKCLSDTWEWDGAQWVRSQGSPSPRPRMGHAMVFDKATGKVLLEGGYYSDHTGIFFNYYDDTWLWDGKSWAKVTASPHPSARAWACIACDSSRGRTVLFGGNYQSPFSYQNIYLGDTWEWDGRGWNQVKPGLAPSPRTQCSLAYDPNRKRTVLFGGYTSSSSGSLRLNDTWEWDGRNWFRMPTNPTPPAVSSGPAMVFAPFLGKTVLFAGVRYSEVWEYSVARRAAFSVRGQGCRGSNGKVPLLVAKTLPRLGGNFTLELKNAPLLTVTVLLVGLTPVRFDLGPLGAPGCVIVNNPDLTFPNATNLAGVWSFPHSFPIPVDTNLIGGKVYLQVVLKDLKANPFGATVTNGGLAVVDW